MKLTSVYALALFSMFGAVLASACIAPGSSGSAQAESPPEPVALIPIPASVQLMPGVYRHNLQSEIHIQDEVLLEWELGERLLEVVDPAAISSKAVVWTVAESRGITLALGESLEELGLEGYRIRITPDELRITGATPSGVFYGIQTLRQLLPELEVRTVSGVLAGKNPMASYTNWVVPCCEIVDSPRFPWRGQLLDVSRHFLPLEFVKKNIDYLAALKLNVFHWHLTDDQGWRVEVDAYPRLTSVGAWRVDHNELSWHARPEQREGELASYGGFYSREEIADVIEYARLRGVTVVPEIDVPGHSRAAIAAYPGISCDGVVRAVATGGIMEENALCPGKEATFELVAGVLTSVMELFPSEYIHIGGDECNKSAWSQCKDCRRRMDEEGLANVEELQSYFIQRVERVINSQGRIMIGWDEILEGGLAPNAVVMSWRGEAGGVAAARAGHDVIMTPNNFCYLDLKQGSPENEPELGYSELLLSTAYSYEPLPEELSDEQARHVLGIQGNLWGESIQGEEEANYMLFPRLFAVAEVAWSAPSLRNWDGFMERLDPALARLENRGVGFAPSLYQVQVDVQVDAENSRVELILSTEHGRLDMRYTTDGTPPTGASELYRKPIDLAKSTDVQAAAFRGKERLGRITSRRIDLHKAIGKAVQTDAIWSPKYDGGGAFGLVDGKTGSATHSDNKWVGYEAVHMDATVDLGEVMALNEVALGCLEEQNSWIFFPTSVNVLISTDGVDFQQAGSAVATPITSTSGAHRMEFTTKTPGLRARFVRVQAKSLLECPEWHKGAGGKAWMFLDEIVVR